MLKIDFASYDAAKYACEHWHYSRAIPAGKRVMVGVWEDDSFRGCVIFGSGANNHIGSPYGLKQTEICELTRVALRSHKTPVSRIVRIAIKYLLKVAPSTKMIVSYADPSQGHHGGIYQAGNWVYVGKGTSNREIRINGKKTHKRTVFSRYGRNGIEALQKIGINAHVVLLPQKLKYLMPLSKDMKELAEKLRKPYPKKCE